MSEAVERKLELEGVFMGAHGLEGLAEADEFWEKQEYGTRIYYGDGNFDYLHRDVLKAAIRALSAPSEMTPTVHPIGSPEWRAEVDRLAAIRAAVLAEREACAKLVESYFPTNSHGDGPGIHCAASIRARKEGQ